MKNLARASLLLLLTVSASAQTATDVPPADGRPAETPVMEALSMLAQKDFLGTQDEAKRLAGLVLSSATVSIAQTVSGYQLLHDGKAEAVSAVLGRALERVDQHAWVIQAASATPVTASGIDKAFRSSAAVSAVQTLFDKSLKQAFRFEGNWISLQIVGEATTIDGKIELHEHSNPVAPVLRELVEVRHDTTSIKHLFDKYPEEMAELDSNGGLKGFLDFQPALEARKRAGGLTDERIAYHLDKETSIVISLAYGVFTLDPWSQLKTMCTDKWNGRYVGIWHTLPPLDAKGGWSAGGTPTFADLDFAVDLGQFLVLAFDPQGFDVYDLSAVGQSKTKDLRLAKKVSYRSNDWRKHFQDIYDEMHKK